MTTSDLNARRYGHLFLTAPSISRPISPIISTRAEKDDSDEIIEASFSRLYSVFFITMIIFCF